MSNIEDKKIIIAYTVNDVLRRREFNNLNELFDARNQAESSTHPAMIAFVAAVKAWLDSCST